MARCRGLYAEAARNMQANYQRWEQGRKGKLGPKLNQMMQQADIGMDAWRAIFLYTPNYLLCLALHNWYDPNIFAEPR